MSHGSPAERVPVVCLDLAAEHQYLSIISAALVALLERVEDIAERDVVTYGIQLAVQEACTNIVDHAYGGQAQGRIAIEIFLANSPRRITVDLYDHGRPFDESEASAPNLEEPQVRGYGIFLMRELVDSVHYERVADRNHWRLIKLLTNESSG